MTKTLQVKDKKIKIYIWDTVGHERIKNITQSWFSGAAGVMIAFAVDDVDSFHNVVPG